jgi:anthranilate synthase component 1
VNNEHALTQVASQRISVPYSSDPLAQYYAMCNDTQNTMLLESAEIDSKDNLKSIMLLQACVRMECHGQRVELVAQNSNGRAALHLLQHSLAPYIAEQSDALMICEFPAANPNIDEETRLQSDNVFSVLRHLVTQIPHEEEFGIFLGGCFAYDLFAVAEALPDVPNGANTCPDFVFYLADTLCVIDHQQRESVVIQNRFCQSVEVSTQFAEQQRRWVNAFTQEPTHLQQQIPAPRLSLGNNDIQVDKSDAEFCEDVLSLKEHILAGDIFQVVPSRTFSLPCPEPILAYAELKQLNPSPYMFYMHDEAFSLFGASPESALKYTAQTNQVEIYPIAGTRPRGKRPDGTIDRDLDGRIELDLREDIKEKSEHIMLVDLARNDVARVSQPGTRHVKELLKVDRYSHVMHLVSRVVGQLQPQLDALHAYQACMNMGTLVGAPKVSAAKLIRAVEQQRRGSYGGAVGYLDGQGNMDTCIVIRSAFVQHGIAHIQAGAGVVHDSVPQSEADETRAKAQAVMRAIIQSQGQSHE